jgi:hypothetical protein
MGPSNQSRTPSLFSRNSSYSKNSKSSRSSGSSYETGSYDANAEFRACLSRTVSELPSQPCSLPPSFIVSFARRAFCLELCDVDFSQGLTSLDYMKDLENRWKKELHAAFTRLNVTSQDAADPENSELARKYPGVMEWYIDVSKKARTIAALYTQVYLGMRRWILLNQMLLEPYDKANCLAMLNTLLPPVRPDAPTPTPQLSHTTLEKQRDAFFKLITNFDSNPEILEPMMTQGARPGEQTGWAALHEAFDRYLKAVVELIDECSLINEPAQVDKAGHSRRTDSGISFGRPATAHSTDAEKPLPEFPAPSDTSRKHGSIMERFTTSISSWGRKKDPKKEQEKEFARSLKKMQSCKELNSSRAASLKTTDFPKMSFDLTEQKRRRLIDEALARKAADAAEAEAQTIGQAI